MKLDRLTVKAQEAVASARDVAMSRHHAEIGPEHLLVALLEQEGGVVPRILSKLGADPRVVRADVDKTLDRLPKVHGAALDVVPSRAFKDVWEAAGKEAEAMKDEYISTEHFLIALAGMKGPVGQALGSAGATKDAILEALVAV